MDDIVEVLLNVALENVPIPNIRRKKATSPQKRYVIPLIEKAKNKAARRLLIYKQSGGFLTAVLPLIASIVGSIAANV